VNASLAAVKADGAPPAILAKWGLDTPPLRAG
jgi:hypothetical protein